MRLVRESEYRSELLRTPTRVTERLNFRDRLRNSCFVRR